MGNFGKIANKKASRGICMCQVNLANEDGKTVGVAEVADFFQDTEPSRADLKGICCAQCGISFASHERNVTAIGQKFVHLACVKKFVQHERNRQREALQVQAASA